MKVLVVNTSENFGGAAIAAKRLVDTLNKQGVKTMMLVRDKTSKDITVTAVKGMWRSQLYFLWERWCIFWHLRFTKQHLFELDMANVGHDITQTKAFKEADVIHLHWVNQGMLSLKGIKKIIDSGKPVVWTMHDAWPATAICHLTFQCERFAEACHHCPYLPKGGGENDLAAKVWKRKAKVMAHSHISMVACSEWLANEAKKSQLLTQCDITAIPNPIDTRVFVPGDKMKARAELGLPRDKKLVLFVSQKANNPNKGMNYLVMALKRMEAWAGRAEVVVFGGHAEEVAQELPLPVHAMGYVNDIQKMVRVYQAADVFVLPSLSENLPNTIMEAMACALPCVAFHVGGIPEEIDHKKNGYVAQYKDTDDLAKGMEWVLTQNDDHVAQEALRKVRTCFSQDHVAMKYIDVYQKAVNHKQVRS